MSVPFAALLGAIQGFTEFLPISSKTHLVVVPALLDRQPPSLEFIVLLHLGTLIALVLYFFRDLWALLIGLIRGGEGRRLAVLLVVASIPAGVLGLLFERTFEELLSRPRQVAFSLLATTVILVGAEWLSVGLPFAGRAGSGGRSSGGRRLARPPRPQPTTKDAVVIGLAQAAALLPGISRSGVTMSAGLLSGLSRDAAARFAFLLAIPAIAGANILEMPEVIEAGIDGPEIAGLLAAAATGFACVALLLRYLRRFNYLPFAAYCAVFAVAAGLALS